jgi:leucyl/phenylalanyl-tRNA---protein transferase
MSVGGDLWFPDVADAREDGLLAIGGDLCADRLLLAYKSGIFPWYNDDEPIQWWSPDPRFVLLPHELKVSASMRQVMKKGTFTFSFDTAFEQVITRCSAVERAGQNGTWIGNDMIAAYVAMHRLGHAHSAEAWQNGELVGGLYGIWLGNVFFGESMFSTVSNASKFAFINWVTHLRTMGVELIDCQVHTDHLQSLGARMMPRSEFVRSVKQHT